jgi:hypothetical protein
MDKTKRVIMVLLYLLSVVAAIPVAILVLLGCIVLYGVLKIENLIIRDIWEQELIDMWNKLIGLFSEAFDSFKDIFRNEMEL